MQQVNLQLYGRTASTKFSEDVSVRRSLTLTPDPRTVDLTLVAPDGDKLIELRLDPDDKPSSILLLGLIVKTDTGVKVFEWNGKPETLSGLANIELGSEGGHVLLESQSSDPFLLIPLDEPRPSVVLELSVASTLAVKQQDDLAGAVRALQISLRFALDDLASEQEGLQEAVLLNQTNARAEKETVNNHLADIRTRATGFGASLDRARTEILGEVRDDWRSVNRQIADSFDAALRQARERDVEITSDIRTEVSNLVQAIQRQQASADLMNEIRHELQVRGEGEVVAKIRELKAELLAANERIRSIEGSLAWRLTHPFASGRDG